MRINEVMKETGLTKKAIYYYENEGLINPEKDPGNNYRFYTEEDVRRLIVINILRRLDVPIKTISGMIRNSVSMKDVLQEQLILTNRKINQLYQNKFIMNDLILKDIKERDFSLNTLKEFNQKLDNAAAGHGYVGSELERIFPGMLGKTLAVCYGNFLSVPLDADEKAAAWNDLVRKIDEMREIDFPEDIRKIIDDLYDDMDAGSFMAKEAVEGYTADPDNRRKAEGYDQLQSFIISNIDLFREIDTYIGSSDRDPKS